MKSFIKSLREPVRINSYEISKFSQDSVCLSHGFVGAHSSVASLLLLRLIRSGNWKQILTLRDATRDVPAERCSGLFTGLKEEWYRRTIKTCNKNAREINDVASSQNHDYQCKIKQHAYRSIAITNSETSRNKHRKKSLFKGGSIKYEYSSRGDQTWHHDVVRGSLGTCAWK